MPGATDDVLSKRLFSENFEEYSTYPLVRSLAWTGHLVHVTIPISMGGSVQWKNFLDVLPHPQGLGPLLTEKQILIEPIFSQWIQSAHDQTEYGFDVLLSSTSDSTFNAGQSIWLLGLNTTTLILVKGALDAHGSKFMSDKKDFGYSFPCNDLGRGGTCDILAWDAFDLAVFWMFDTIGCWKHITLWQGNVSQFHESSTYLMEWLRDYLWLLVFCYEFPIADIGKK
ncbi:Photosystem I P700 chlorophyll a apoprotein A2 [Cucumis melo var. makuwa]|uniref:Photosystem I P700 chlorophyll a apoprotein A2 n=1 Tax=Cucumis melo var. makuwa TaxID=1194695 RepID=A0A5D3CIS1_CUCMM|nr:Photosystem I P700 chlorophyll a apoprotein A2 [Cucumis melo var. makuwa]